MREWAGQLFRVKTLSRILAESEDPRRRLRKVLGAPELVLFGVGVIIGAGIFATVGTAAAGDAVRPGAGPALMVSFLLTAVACGLAALCYAEFASLVPISGSAYTYSYATFGELVAWIIGWDLMLEYCVGSIAVSLSWSGYFTGLMRSVGLDLPHWMTIDFRSAMQGYQQAVAQMSQGVTYESLTPALQNAWTAVHYAPRIGDMLLIVNLPACLIVMILTMLLVRGIRESSKVNIAIVIIKLLVLGFFITLGAFYIKPENWVPFAPNGFAGIKAGAAIAFFAYIGFDCVSTAAEETKNPKRDMPIGIIGSLIVCTIIYVLVAAVFTGIIPVELLKTSLAHQKGEPLALAMQHVNLGWAAVVIAFGSITAQIAVLLVLLMGQSRILFSMSRDGLLPSVFSRVHEKFRTPHVTTLGTGFLVALVAAFTNIDEMVDLTNIGTLFAFVLVCIGIIILRVREPARPRGFRVPWSPVLPLLGAGACLFLMTALPAVTWIRFGLWLGLGLVVYFCYGIRRSRLADKPAP